MQRLSAVLQCSLGSYLRDALQEGAVLMLSHAFMFLGRRFFPLFSSFLLVASAAFFVRKHHIIAMSLFVIAAVLTVRLI
jgi:hypothetical protein